MDKYNISTKDQYNSIYKDSITNPEEFWSEIASKNFIWTFPNKLVVDKSIIVDNDPNWQSKNYDCFGVCSDWIK